MPDSDLPVTSEIAPDDPEDRAEAVTMETDPDPEETLVPLPIAIEPPVSVCRD